MWCLIVSIPDLCPLSYFDTLVVFLKDFLKNILKEISEVHYVCISKLQKTQHVKKLKSNYNHERAEGKVRNRHEAATHSKNLKVEPHQVFNKDSIAINRYKINDMEFIFLNP